MTLALLGFSESAGALPVTTMEGTGTDTERRYPLPSADGVTIDRRAQIILVRHASHVYAMALACPHENAVVKWIAKDGRFQCSKHDSRYTPEGTYTSGHATRNLDRFPVRRELNEVVVTVDRVYRSDQSLPAWTSAGVAL
ncbi:MAG: Rieske (2Fe-2S) protein [Acidobacteria bacterium]|nr:Rieske (2Fe-2S) protein [Acidobacteriota bacterium]